MEDIVNQIIEDLGERTEKFGVYLRHAVATPTSDDPEIQDKLREGDLDEEELRRMLVDGEAQSILFAVFTLNDVAFSERVQNPDKTKADDDFLMVMPTESELLRDKIARRIAEGKDPFEEDEDDD